MAAAAAPVAAAPLAAPPSATKEDAHKYEILSSQCLFRGCNKMMVKEDKWDRHVHSFNGSKGRYICLSKQCIACFTDQ